MFEKKVTLFVLLSVLSVAAGSVFGLLDVFGFVDGRHNLSTALFILAITVIYLVLITVFISDFAEDKRVNYAFVLASVFFGTTFFFMNLNIALSLFTAFSYLLFLIYAYTASSKRANNQITFSPKEIFLPVLRNSMLFLLIIVSSIAFAQSQRLISVNRLINPSIVKFAAAPAIYTLNHQLNNEIANQMKALPDELIASQGEKQLVELILVKTVEATAESNGGDIYGFKPDEIPVELIEVSNGGRIDITPMINEMMPQIAEKLNEYIQQYSYITPFAVAILTFLVFQPLMIPVNIVESALTLVVFKLLIHFGVLKISKVKQEVEKLHL